MTGFRRVCCVAFSGHLLEGGEVAERPQEPGPTDGANWYTHTGRRTGACLLHAVYNACFLNTSLCKYNFYVKIFI